MEEGVVVAGYSGELGLQPNDYRRFEAAVNTLGIDQAKPQAISQLMNCEGEGAPTDEPSRMRSTVANWRSSTAPSSPSPSPRTRLAQQFENTCVCVTWRTTPPRGGP